MLDVTSKTSTFLDQRLQQIMGDTKVFGGIIVVLIGDTGQLPAVLGRVM